MKADSRLSSALHVMLHMAHAARPLTSEELAKMLRTNPVVVRRTLGGLRARGYLASEKGHGGGWALARPLEDVTLYNVYEALGEPEVFAIGHRSERPACLVEQAVNSALDEAIAEAEALVRARLRQVTLADLAREFDKEAQRRDHASHPPHGHQA